MLHSLDFRNVHQTADRLFIKNLTIRREHWSQLKRQHLRESLARSSVNGSFLLCRPSVQAARLKQNRNSTTLNDGIHLLPIQRNNVAALPLNVRSRNEWNILSQRLSCPEQDLSFFAFTEVIDITGVHVHSVQQSCLLRRPKMFLKCLDGHMVIRCIGQERRRNTLHFAPWLLPLNKGCNGHRFAFAAFNFCANSETL